MFPVIPEEQIERQLATTELAVGWDVLASFFRSDHTRMKGHVHAGMEVGMVLSGELDMHFAEAELKCGPGDVWLCGMWEPHAWRVYAGTTNIALVFLPDLLTDQMSGDPPYLDLFASPPDSRPRVTDADLRQRMLAIGNDIRRETKQQGPFWRTMIRLDLLRIVSELCRVPGASPPVGRRSAAGDHLSNLARMTPAVKLVQEQPRHRVKVDEAAGACGLSRSQFQRIFRNAMGTSFGRFCQRARLAFAAHRLRHTGATVEAIAEAAGFADVSHLCKTFVRHHGCTPNEYRSLR